MSKFKCPSCGCIFDEEDAGTYRESRGEFWGSPAYETMLCCPECRETEIEEYYGDDEDEDDED